MVNKINLRKQNFELGDLIFLRFLTLLIDQMQYLKGLHFIVALFLKIIYLWFLCLSKKDYFKIMFVANSNRPAFQLKKH